MHSSPIDCIGSAFNAKGTMQCPNCRQVEEGQWLFSSGCYVQQQLLRNSNSDEDYTTAGMLYNLYRYDEPLSHPSRRHPLGAYRQIPLESEYPSSTNRWRAEVPRLNEVARPLASDLDSSPASRNYMQSSQTLNMLRAPLHEIALPNSHMLEGSMPRQRMDEDDLLYHHEPATGFAHSHRYATNRDVMALSSVSNLEQPTAVTQFQDTRYGQLGAVAYNTRRVGAYTPRTPYGHEWGNSHGSVHRAFASPYNAEVHQLHPVNRTGESYSFYDGHRLGARVPWF